MIRRTQLGMAVLMSIAVPLVVAIADPATRGTLAADPFSDAVIWPAANTSPVSASLPITAGVPADPSTPLMPVVPLMVIGMVP